MPNLNNQPEFEGQFIKELKLATPPSDFQFFTKMHLPTSDKIIWHTPEGFDKVKYPNGVKLAIVGSRTYRDYVQADEWFKLIMKRYEIKEIISGGADGVDSIAELFAERYNIPIVVFKPKWKDSEGKYDRFAGFKRNTEIVSKADVIFAIHEANSKGTADSIKKAKNLGKETIVINVQ